MATSPMLQHQWVGPGELRTGKLRHAGWEWERKGASLVVVSERFVVFVVFSISAILCLF